MPIYGSEKLNLIKILKVYIIKKNIAVCLYSAIFFLLFSCQDKSSAPQRSKKANFPSQILKNTFITQRDSGKVSLRFKAPVIEKYELVDSPYVVAKKGFYLEYFDKKKPDIPGKIWADNAIFYEKKDFYQAKGNVKILTNEGTSFATQTIFWDRQKKKMYTKDTVYVMDNKGNTLVGANGMLANDDFSEYSFYNNAGDFNAQEIPTTKK